MSLRTRIVVTFSALTLVVVAVVSVLVYVTLGSQLVSVVDAALEDRVVDTVRDVQRGDLDIGDDDRLTQIVDADGIAIVSSRSVPLDTVLIAVDIDSVRMSGPLRETVTVDGLSGRVRVHAEIVDTANGPVVVVVGRSLAAVDESRRRVLIGLLAGAPIVGAMIAASGWFLARRILAPVAEMSRRASQIGGSEERIHIGGIGGRDEFSGLAGSFNKLLGRISEVRDQERRFIADVSHELRTPLAIVRGELELLVLDSDDDGSAVSVAARGSIEEVDRMTNLIDRLLLLARARAADVFVSSTRTSLRAFVDEIVARLPTSIDGSDVAIDTASVAEVVMDVDCDVVTQIVVNLLSNAVRHAYGTVWIAVGPFGGGGLCIVVADDGDGFPAEMIESGIVRFGRGTAGPRGQGSQMRFGIGLAIVQAVATAHGGAVTIANRTDDNGDVVGGEVTVRLAAPVGVDQTVS